MHIERITTTDIAQPILDLLLEADPNPYMVWDYLANGELYVTFEDTGIPCCVAVMIDFQDGTCELKNLATAEKYRNQRLATHMIDYLCDLFAKRGCMTMQVGTADAGAETTVKFYQNRGFVQKSVITGFFLSYPQPVIDNGRQCIDMILLEKQL